MGIWELFARRKRVAHDAESLVRSYCSDIVLPRPCTHSYAVIACHNDQLVLERWDKGSKLLKHVDIEASEWCLTSCRTHTVTPLMH